MALSENRTITIQSMTNKTTEPILCIPRESFEENGTFQGFLSIEGRDDLGRYLSIHPEFTQVAHFHPREQAEKDESRKQLISYCLIMCGEKVLVYERGKKGSEKRLHTQLSVGIGGHVDEADDPDEPFFAYQNSVRRELKEEIGLDIDHNAIKNTVLGLVNDESNPVGRVHLGVVHLVSVDEVQAERILANCEDTLIDPSFVALSDFENEELLDKLETWSQYVVEHLLADSKKNGPWNDMAFKERMGLLAICASRLASAATGYILQENPHGHEASKAVVEEEMGNLHCMYSGVVANKDIDPKKMTEHGKAFMSSLNHILKHQTATPTDEANHN